MAMATRKEIIILFLTMRNQKSRNREVELRVSIPMMRMSLRTVAFLPMGRTNSWPAQEYAMTIESNKKILMNLISILIIIPEATKVTAIKGIKKVRPRTRTNLHQLSQLLTEKPRTTIEVAKNNPSQRYRLQVESRIVGQASKNQLIRTIATSFGARLE